jgi:hypothetical protein
MGIVELLEITTIAATQQTGPTALTDRFTNLLEKTNDQVENRSIACGLGSGAVRADPGRRQPKT